MQACIIMHAYTGFAQNLRDRQLRPPSSFLYSDVSTTRVLYPRS